MLFSQEIAEGLIHANKATTPGSSRGRPSKRKSGEESVQKRPRGKKPAIPLPGDDVHYDCLGNWPIPTSDKKRYRLCQEYSRMTCGKCKVHLCLI